MGYSTEFKGELKFTEELTVTQLGKVKSFCGEDCRDHVDWAASDQLTYVDLELLEDFSGIKWDGSEKTHDLDKLINMITINMRQEYLEFGFSGKLLAQGEDIDDRYELVAEKDGLIHKKKIAVTGTCITCPCCEYEFIYDGEPK